MPMSRYTLHSNLGPLDDTVQLSEVMPSNQLSDDEPLDEGQGHYTDAYSNPNTNQSGTMETPNVNRGDEQPIISKWKGYGTVAVLLFVNLLNYMDRFTVAGVLLDVRKYYAISASEAGIIQTAFIITYMLASPVFGYMGDRFTRKYLMAVGIMLWSIFTLASSFMPADKFWAFVLLRALVGIGEASYSTIAPTLIADLFAKEQRTRMLMVFYFAIPVGSGMGYIVGANMASAFGAWQWALRFTPVLGIVSVVLILLFCVEPPRGMSEGGDVQLQATSVKTDLKALAYNKSFVWSTVGFTCVAFVTGALAFLAPTFMFYATQMQGNPMSEQTIALLFGGITCAAGILGVGTGAEISRRFRRVNPRADALVCAFGLLSSAPFLYFAIVLSASSTYATWILIFIGETLISINWSVTADILLRVVIPTRRSLAEAGQILTSHALGDAISPYIIGQIQDALSEPYLDPSRPSVQYLAMQQALYVCTFVCVIGGGCYLATALYYERDCKRAERITQGRSDPNDFSDDDLLIGADVNFVSEDESLNADQSAVAVVQPGIQNVGDPGDAGVPVLSYAI